MIMPPCRLLIPALFAATLAGCASVGETLCERLECPAPEPAETVSLIEDTTEPVPIWVETLRIDVAASETERAMQYDSLRPRLDPEHCDAFTVRLAALHMLHPEPPEEDIEDLRSALAHCTDEGRNDEYHELASLLLTGFTRHAEGLDQQAGLEAQIADERKRNAALEEQIEALRAIEQSIRERGR